MRRPAKIRRLVFATLLCTVSAPLLAAPPTIEECDALARDAPRDHESYDCFVKFVRASGDFDDTVRRLEAILQLDPDRYHAALALGVIERFRSSPRAEDFFLAAAEGAEARDDLEGAVRARAGLGSFYARRSRLDDADAQFDLALQAAEQADDPWLQSGVLVKMALQAKRRSDYGRARLLYQRVESIGFPEGAVQLESLVLSGLGGVCKRLGQFRQAMEYYRRGAELNRRIGDLRGEASARYNVALVSYTLMRRGLAGAPETERRIREGLDAAVTAKNRRVEARSRILLGSMLEGRDAIDQFTEALRIGDEIGHVQIGNWARREIAREKIRQGPEEQREALRLFQQTIDRARVAGDRDDMASGLRSRAFRAAASRRPREEWIPWYLEALDAAEQLRDLQPESTVRARTFTKWAITYISLSGFLLDRLDESPTPREDIELAFRTIERMRGRMLLDTLDASGASLPSDESSALHEAREQLLRQLSGIQRKLMKPSLPDEQRSDALAELGRLESDETATRDRLAREDPAFGNLRAPTIPSLAELRQTLAPDQAILAFQLGNPSDARDYERRGRFSWLMSVTRDETRVFEIPAKDILEQQIDVFQGLFERRDGSERAASSRLYRGLLAEAVSELPEPVTRLIVIPDGVLHRLPFAALRAAPSAPPLVARYSISYSPSATLWMRWKDRGAPPEATPALVLADPDTRVGGDAGETRTASHWTEGLRLDRLPHARREADALIRSMGDGVLRTGGEASESYLKQADLGSFGLLHFAAHAVLDDRNPQRSAVVLAPGNDDEDGLLQAREIVDLDLQGSAVVLSACRSASGTLLDGEGVMGLAHAFFQAGAHAVVGSLWPLRDEEAASLLSRFAEHLARGVSVGEALAAAQDDLISGGQPAAAWAGVVVLGDGDLVPLPGGRPGASNPAKGWLLVLAVLVLGLLVVRFRHARARLA